jgi:hypothetical protein
MGGRLAGVLFDESAEAVDQIVTKVVRDVAVESVVDVRGES